MIRKVSLKKSGREKARRQGSKPKEPKTLRERLAAAIGPDEPSGMLRLSITRQIDKLRKKEKWSFRERHGKTDFYEYLEDVYNVRDWNDVEGSESWAGWLARLYNIKGREKMDLIRIVIEATSNEDDRQVKSRWARAIRYAVEKSEKVRKVGFIEFLEENGGVSGCAEKMAELERRANRS
jgi:hypothetical protein